MGGWGRERERKKKQKEQREKKREMVRRIMREGGGKTVSEYTKYG